jgi:hypothetical protein
MGALADDLLAHGVVASSVLNDLGEYKTTEEVRLLLLKYHTDKLNALNMAEFLDLLIDLTVKRLKEAGDEDAIRRVRGRGRPSKTTI